MTPDSRVLWALGMAFLMWLPVAYGMLTNGVDVVYGGLLFLGALAITWVGTGIIVNLTAGYRRSANEVERAKRQIEELERRMAAEQRRRSSDRKPENESPGSADTGDLPPNV